MCRRRFLYHKNNYGRKKCLPYMYVPNVIESVSAHADEFPLFFISSRRMGVTEREKSTLLRNKPIVFERVLLSVLSKISGVRGYQASAKSCRFVNYCNELCILWICFGVRNSAFYYIAIFTCISLKLAK